MPRALFMLLLTLLIPTQALGQQHHEAPPNIIGVKALGLFLVEHAHASAGGGLSVFYERADSGHHLEGELSLGLLWHDDVTLLPVELLLKLPFHPTPALEPYVGVGAVLDILLAPRLELEPGVMATAGTYLWLGDTFGLDVELAYTVVFQGHTPIHEITPALGGVIHF